MNTTPTTAVRVANQIAYATGVALRWTTIGLLIHTAPMIAIPVALIVCYRLGSK